jgi:hypothetical protein
MLVSQLPRSLLVVATLISLVTLAGTSDLTVEVISRETAPEKVHLYNENTPCRPGYLPKNSGYYGFDQCHRIEPFAIKQLQIVQPAVCATGARALFTLFKTSSCNEGFGSASTEVSDAVVGNCMDVRRWWSFAFVCDGVVEERGTVIDLSSFLLIAGMLLLALGIGIAFLFCGGFVMVMGGLGLLFWGFWSLGKGMVVS